MTARRGTLGTTRMGDEAVNLAERLVDKLVDALERKAESYHRRADMRDGTLICLACSTRRKPVVWPCSKWSELNARRAARGKAFM